MNESLEDLPKIEIFPATPGDALGIQKLMHESVFKTYVNEKAGITIDDIENFYKDEFTAEGLEKLAKGLAETEAGERHFVAKDRGDVVGYCRVKENPEENLLARIHVLPDRKHQRLGTLLWEKARAELNPRKDTALWVVDYNEDAIKAYERWGFTDTGERRSDSMKSGSERKSIKMLLKSQEAI